MRRRPRVLFVGAFPPPGRRVFGGMVSSCTALLQSSLPQRVELDLFDTTQVSNPPPGLAVRAMLAFARTLRYVWRFERRTPDVVLLFAAVGASLLEKGVMAWYARLRGVPAYLFPRGGAAMDAYRASRMARAWMRLSFRGASKVLCQSEAWQRFVIEAMDVSADKVPVIPNWTASSELLAIGRARTFGVGPVRFLFLGWLDREKGVEELLNAFHEAARVHEINLDLVGEGNLSSWARDFVAGNDLSARVTFHGWLSGEDLAQVLAATDVLALPSWAEGLPNAMIEAMAAGLAVIITPVGGVPDVVSDGQQALLVPPRDSAALRNALVQLATDAQLRERLARAGHALAAECFGVERAVNQLVHEMTAACR